MEESRRNPIHNCQALEGVDFLSGLASAIAASATDTFLNTPPLGAAAVVVAVVAAVVGDKSWEWLLVAFDCNNSAVRRRKWVAAAETADG